MLPFQTDTDFRSGSAPELFRSAAKQQRASLGSDSSIVRFDHLADVAPGRCFHAVAAARRRVR
jgi:hypothetical protein